MHVPRAATEQKSETCLAKEPQGVGITFINDHVQKNQLGKSRRHPSPPLLHKRKSLADDLSPGSDILGCTWVSTPPLSVLHPQSTGSLGGRGAAGLAEEGRGAPEHWEF